MFVELSDQLDLAQLSDRCGIRIELSESANSVIESRRMPTFKIIMKRAVDIIWRSHANSASTLEQETRSHGVMAIPKTQPAALAIADCRIRCTDDPVCASQSLDADRAQTFGIRHLSPKQRQIRSSRLSEFVEM